MQYTNDKIESVGEGTEVFQNILTSPYGQRKNRERKPMAENFRERTITEHIG